MDEYFAGCEAGDLVGGHAAVRATDPEVLGGLLVGEFGKERRIFCFNRGGPVAVFFQEVGECVHRGLGLIQAVWRMGVHHGFGWWIFFALAKGVAGIGMGRAVHGMRRVMEWQHGIFGLMELSAGTAGGRTPGGDPCRVA